MEVEEMKDHKEDIDIKDEPPDYDLSSSLESEGVNVIRVLKSELKNDVNIKCEHLDCAHNETDSVSVIGSLPTPTSEKFINREMKEDEEEEKIDIKYESLEYGLKRSAIENANEHGEKQFECHKCCYKSKYKYTLKRHIMFIHEKEEIPRHACQLCSFKAFHARNLKRHIMLQHAENMFECPKCSYKSKYKHAINRHFMSQHTESVFECHKCSYKSKDNSNLGKHILLYHQKEPAPQHACDICSYRSIYKSNLKRHIMKNHTDFRLECILCQKAWHQRDSFKHLLTTKVSECPKCSYVTGDVTRLKNHLLTHEKDHSKLKFECYTCGYKCVEKSSLIRHVRIHTGQLPFSCTECNERFNSKRSLNGHIVSRHKENEELIKTVTSKIHQCLKCSYKTILSANLKKHIQCCDNK